MQNFKNECTHHLITSKESLHNMFSCLPRVPNIDIALRNLSVLSIAAAFE